MSSAWSNIPHKIHRCYRQSFFISKVHPLHIHRKYASITPSFFINCSSDNCPTTHGLPINNNSKIIFSWIWAKCTHIYRKSTVLNCKNVTFVCISSFFMIRNLTKAGSFGPTLGYQTPDTRPDLPESCIG